MKATQSTVETWLPVVGYEGVYEVSDLGRVRSLPRLDSLGRRVPGRVLKPSTSGGRDYPHINLCMAGECRSERIHVLVAAAFLGPKPRTGGRIEVCHANNDKCDARASNLRWDTQSANAVQTVTDGINQRRNQTHCLNGHEYTPENVRWYVNPRSGRPNRACITCKLATWRAAVARSRARRRAA